VVLVCAVALSLTSTARGFLIASAADGKRKAAEEPSSPTATKRVKHNESTEPEKKPRIVPAIPFPEKVRTHSSQFCRGSNLRVRSPPLSRSATVRSSFAW